MSWFAQIVGIFGIAARRFPKWSVPTGVHLSNLCGNLQRGGVAGESPAEGVVAYFNAGTFNVPALKCAA